MTDQETTGAEAEAQAAPEVTPEDMISRGKGMSTEAVEALDDASPAKQAWREFKALVARRNEAVELGETLTEERNQAVYKLKNEHDIGFSAMAEVIGVTSSMVLYIHERAQGKSAKQIREESERSRLAKEQFRETDPNRKAARKQTPAEKELRKRQREELKRFLAEERARAEAAGETTEVTDEELASLDEDE